jgi:hypothetical protein
MNKENPVTGTARTANFTISGTGKPLVATAVSKFNPVLGKSIYI